MDSSHAVRGLGARSGPGLTTVKQCLMGLNEKMLRCTLQQFGVTLTPNGKRGAKTKAVEFDILD